MSNKEYKLFDPYGVLCDTVTLKSEVVRFAQAMLEDGLNFSVEIGEAENTEDEEDESGDVDEELDSVEDLWRSEGRIMAGMAHGNRGLADYDGLELDGPDGYAMGGCEGHQGCTCEDCGG